MANALKTLFGDIAQAIRDQNGDPPEVKYKPAEFPEKIKSITAESGPGDIEYVDGVDPYYRDLAYTLMVRNAKHLSGDETTLTLKGFTLPNGSKLGSLNDYSFAGFTTVEGMEFSDIAMVYKNALVDCPKLKILDITAGSSSDLCSVLEGGLNGCPAMQAVIIRNGGGGLNYASVHKNNGSNDTFCVFVPSDNYDAIVGNLDSNYHVPASRYRKLEDYPVIDNWNKTFTVEFYDGETLVDTKTVKCGKNATSGYTKEGYIFNGWSPEPTNVVEDMKCYGSWVPSFATASWKEITSLTNAGTSSSVYKVGDTKTELLTYTDGTTEEIELVIAKIRDDGTMVLALNHALATKKQMNSSSTGGQSGYFNQPLYSYLTGTVYPAMSNELRTAIRSVPTGIFGSYNIFLPTSTNCGTSDTSDMYKCIGDLALDLFSTASNRIRKLGKNGTTAVDYWLGSSGKSGSYYYYSYIDASGNVTYKGGAANGIQATRGVVFLIVV